MSQVEEGYKDRGTTRSPSFQMNSDNTRLFKLMDLLTTDNELEDVARDACSNDCLISECLKQYFAWGVVQYHKGN